MRLESFDLNLLVALDALLTERNVSRAAERLLVGQPAMSATLRRLRLVFDDPLLVREGRRLKATPLAESLSQPVAEILTRVESVLNARSTFDPLVDGRTFTIIASDYVALVLLRPLLERLQSLAPNVQIHMRPVEGMDALEQLSRNNVDLVIAPKELLARPNTAPSEPLFRDRFVCVVDGQRQDLVDGITADEFSRMPYLVSNHGRQPSIVESRLDDLGVSRNVEMVANSFVMAPFLLPGTNLVTVIQEKLALLLMGDGSKFTILSPPVELDDIVELMVWNPKHTNDAGHEWLRGQLRELAAHI